MNKTYNVSGFNIKDVDKKKIVRWVLIAAAAIILIALVSTSFYTVSDKEVAVVTTFGKLSGIKSAGSLTMTSAVRGCFKDLKTREEALRLLGL